MADTSEQNRRKQQIIDASTKLFYEQGYDFTTTRELAAASNISVAGLYYFFKDKQEILFNILYDSVNNLYETLESAIKPNDDPLINVKRYIRSIIEYVLQNKLTFTILMREDLRLNKGQLETINNKRRNAFEVIKNELVKLQTTKRIKTLDPAVIAFALIGMTNWVVFWYDSSGALSIDDIIEQTTDIFLSGIISKIEIAPSVLLLKHHSQK